MIHVKPMTVDDKESYRFGFIVEGHAEFAPHGQDIVCAGVSAIVQTAILGIEYYTYADVEKKEGYVKVHILHDDHTSDVIVKTMLLGLEELEYKYHDYIKIKKTGEVL